MTFPTNTGHRITTPTTLATSTTTIFSPGPTRAESSMARAGAPPATIGRAASAATGNRIADTAGRARVGEAGFQRATEAGDPLPSTVGSFLPISTAAFRRGAAPAVS